MKVIVQTGALQDALALAGSIVQNRSPKPVLKCVKLVAADNMLTVLATDLEVGCRYQIEAVQIEEPGEALIPCDRLNGIAREASGASLTIETDKQTVLVEGAGSKFKIFGYDPGEFPEVAQFEGDADFELPLAALSNMIGKTIFATAKAHSHYAISGVLWEAQASRLMLVATDGYRLAQAKGTLSKKIPEDVRAIVPGKLTSLIQRVSSDGSDPVQVKVDTNQIIIQTPRVTLVGSLVQGNFPKYDDVIPKNCLNQASVVTSDLEHRLRQAALMMTDESRGVRFKFQPKTILMTGSAPEAGEAEVTCPITYDGDEIEIGFNPAFFIEILRVIDDDQITIELDSGAKPAVIKTESGLLFVLMPVQV